MPVRKVLTGGTVPVHVWTDDIEREAERQLLQLASLPIFFRHIAVMPDVHAGRGSAIGTVFASERAVLPAAVGVDIGCGMSAVRTDLHVEDIDERRPRIRAEIEKRVPVGFHHHRSPLAPAQAWDGWRSFADLTSGVHHLEDRARCQLGTLGGGNHFIEVCHDDDRRVWVLLHSGSRNIGKSLADAHIAAAEAHCRSTGKAVPHRDLAYLDIGTPACDQYLHDVLWAQAYARKNRDIMLDLIMDCLRSVVRDGGSVEAREVVRCHHNYVSRERHFGREVWVTRKGAIRAGADEEGIVPGSMGTRSYIVRGKGEAMSFASASHGAGRRMSRTRAKSVFSEKDLVAQTSGVECRKDKGVLDEIPQAYKRVEDVLRNEEDLVEPVVALKQVICVKG